MTVTNKRPSKLLGDAGEHYALSRLSFAGMYAAKMPDNWESYDLAVETGDGLLRVSVKTRSESEGWKTSRWFMFDERKACDWFVFVFKPAQEPLRAWVIPYALAREHVYKTGPERKNAWLKLLAWAKLTKGPLAKYEDNWALKP